jgi:hypothetical protein
MFKKENIVMWLILIVVVAYVGNTFIKESEQKEAMEMLELEMDIQEREAEIELIDEYIEFCEDSAYCE